MKWSCLQSYAMFRRSFARVSSYLMIALLCASIVPTCFSDSSELTQPSSIHSFPLHVVFVGFTYEFVDTTVIDQNIRKNFSLSCGDYTIDYSYNVDYHFASTSYYSSLKNHVLENSVYGAGITSKLNTTALQIQRQTGQRMSIFLPQSGRAINASAVEEWIEAHPVVGDPDISYSVYVMNFTEFDSQDHSLEHWYNITELDWEAKRIRDFWRLEWDNELNPNVKFPYAAFTSQSRILFVDPSAFQWYLTWARIWWKFESTNPKYDYYYEDLDQFLRTHNVRTSAGKTALAYYLAGWIDDVVRNLLETNLWVDPAMVNAKTLSIQAIVLNNASESGYTNDAMYWILNSTFAAEAIEDLVPFIDVNISLSFCYLSEYPELEDIFKNSVIKVENMRTYYDGAKLWTDLYDARATYFNLSAADSVINAYVFLEGNMSMIFGNDEFTGLGGDGQILVMKSIERYFEEDGVSPKTGLGYVFVHEAGHNFGFSHTFDYGRYAGDFAFDVMSYYAYTYFFTQMRKDCLIRLYSDYRLLELQETLKEDMLLYGQKPPVDIIDEKFDEIDGILNLAEQFYAELNFLEAYNIIGHAACSERELNRLIKGYVEYTHISIEADGTVTPSIAPISTLDSFTYTFTDNIFGSIVVNRDNIVIDGAGYLLQGFRDDKGIDVTSRSNVTIRNIEIKHYTCGINIEASSNITVRRNNLTDNECGISLTDSSNNLIYHNIFADNIIHAFTGNSTATWDSGYPSGGNYWKGHISHDTYCGLRQNITGSDGLCDDPYVIDVINQDRYPLAVHNIAVKNAAPLKTVVGQGYGIYINVTVINIGCYSEVFNVTVYANKMVIAVLENLALTDTDHINLLVAWNTRGFPKGSYVISVEIQSVSHEMEAEDNVFSASAVRITLPGDINGDFSVNLSDLIQLTMAYRVTQYAPGWNANADIDNNGAVNLSDLVILAKNYGKP